MISKDKLQIIFDQDPEIEAIVSISCEGLPVHWLTSVPTDIDKISAMAMRMYLAGRNLGFSEDDEQGELTIDTDFGQLKLHETLEQDFLLVLKHRLVRKI